MQKKAETVVLDDPTSPDGKRVIMNYADWTAERKKLCKAADSLCEGCSRPHFLPFDWYGNSHHRLGRGGGRRDDRLFVPMQNGNERNIARWRWFRNLIWCCARGHDRLERMSTKDYKRSLMQYCECGLLKI